MIKKLYDKCVAWAGHRSAKYILAVISFLESFIFPIPTDAMIIPMVIAKREIFEYIEIFCNRQRIRSSIGYVTPVSYEMMYSNRLS